MHETRLKQLRAIMSQQGLDALFVSSAFNVHYLCGFGDDSFLLVCANNAYLITDPRYTEEAGQKAKCASVYTYTRDLYTEVGELAASHGVKRLGFESAIITYATHKTMTEKIVGIELVPTECVVEKLRAKKTPEEVADIERASLIADAALKSILHLVKPGITEKTLDTELRYAFYKNGGNGASFPPIIAFNANASLPHAKPRDVAITDNAVVQFDWGTIYNHYCSDCSRVFFVGKPDPEIEKIYDIVLEANRRAIAAVAPGKKLFDVDAVARDYIKEAGYGDCFGHGTGHGVGLQVHESPRVSFRSTEIAEPGNVVTIEPGIYLPGKGGVRIEDMVLVTEDGCKVLTSFPKNAR